MNRNIKFRAFHHKIGMICDDRIEICFSGKILASGDLFSLGINSASELEIMQFTGLKLKDGTELYEGDKLRYTKHTGYIMEDSILEICWDEEYACFGYKTNTSMFHDMIFAFVNHDCLQEDVLNHCGLIGNIYQNE